MPVYRYVPVPGVVVCHTRTARCGVATPNTIITLLWAEPDGLPPGNTVPSIVRTERWAWRWATLGWHSRDRPHATRCTHACGAGTHAPPRAALPLW